MAACRLGVSAAGCPHSGRARPPTRAAQAAPKPAHAPSRADGPFQTGHLGGFNRRALGSARDSGSLAAGGGRRAGRASCPLRGRSRPGGHKSGGWKGALPFKAPLPVSRSRSPDVAAPPLPQPALGLTCGPGPGSEDGAPGASPRGLAGRRCPGAAERDGGPGRGGGAPSRRPPARGTQPLPAASRAHKPRRRRRASGRTHARTRGPRPGLAAGAGAAGQPGSCSFPARPARG